MLQLYQGKTPHPHIRRNLCSYVAMLHVYTYIYTFVGKKYIYISATNIHIYYAYMGVGCFYQKKCNIWYNPIKRLLRRHFSVTIACNNHLGHL